jgi:hypothetical protein
MAEIELRLNCRFQSLACLFDLDQRRGALAATSFSRKRPARTAFRG